MVRRKYAELQEQLASGPALGEHGSRILSVKMEAEELYEETVEMMERMRGGPRTDSGNGALQPSEAHGTVSKERLCAWEAVAAEGLMQGFLKSRDPKITGSLHHWVPNSGSPSNHRTLKSWGP